jgi:hypothetical protein
MLDVVISLLFVSWVLFLILAGVEAVGAGCDFNTHECRGESNLCRV